MIPDGLALTVGFLRGKLAADVRTEVPAKPAGPTVKITQLDAEDRTPGADHLIAFRLQFDCYAGQLGPAGTGEAAYLTRQVRATLREMPGVHEGTVVSAVRFGVCPQLPDDAWDPPRQRFSLEAWVYTHV